MRLLLFCGTDNSIGRPYCLWLIAQELGWTCTPVVPGTMWPPLAGTPFAEQAVTVEGVTGHFDAVIAHQPVPATLEPALRIAGKAPVVIDVDEPLWEERYGETLVRQAQVAFEMRRRGERPAAVHRLRREANRRPVLVSNPALQAQYKGTVVPHVRSAGKAPSWPDRPFSVAFVGTPREHKGLDRIRAAAAINKVPLIVTADRPDDAGPFERWVGTTTLEQGQRLTEASQCVAVVSDDTPFSRGQLPVKLIDAMLAGRAVIGSDLPPIRWALGDAGILVAPGDQDAVTSAVARLRDHPQEVRRLGAAARARALRMFTPSAVAPAFAQAIQAAIGGAARAVPVESVRVEAERVERVERAERVERVER